MKLYSVPAADGSPGLLSTHIFGNIPLVVVDFSDPKVRQLFRGHEQ